MNPDTLRAYHYFRSHGCRAGEALSLARAEQVAEDAGCTWEWEPDDEPWDGDCPAPDELYGCILRDREGNALASLWSIGDPDAFYVRYVQAQLACEAMDALLSYSI